MRTAVALLALLLAFVLFTGTASGEEYRIAKENEGHFRALLARLRSALESPSGDDAEAIEEILGQIRQVSADDYDVARSIADHWSAVYLNRKYRLFIHRGEETAVTLERSNPPIGEKHAIVVLGYRLEAGEMTPELVGRCRAAAALARSYPDAILVCSGGATGSDNPLGHTEAGMMRDYLVSECGIDPERIFTDERAMTTQENAENTFAILKAQGIRTITIVTSTYHQKWGQVLYNAMSALYEKRYGYSVQIVGNYCYDTEPEEEKYRKGYTIALSQLAGILSLPRE